MKRSQVVAISAAAIALLAMGSVKVISKEPRYAPLTMDMLKPEQKNLGEQVMKVSSVGLGGPYAPLLQSPEMGQHMFDLMGYLRFKTSVPVKLNEFAICIIARQWRSQVEWYAHGPLAAKAGVPQDVLDQLHAKKRPSNMTPDLTTVYEFVTQLMDKHEVSDATFAEATKLLGQQGVVDLTAVAGTYVAVASLLAVSEGSVPEGKELPFKAGEP